MSVKPTEAASLPVVLTTPAPVGGVTVTLKSSDTTKVTVTPASVVIPQGATTPATQPQVTGVGIGTATITASATGYTPGIGTVTVPAPTMAFTGTPLVIAIGGAGNLTLSLAGGQAPASGLTASLRSSDTGKATVPATVGFAAGETSATIPVTGVAAGTTTITASAPNIANATIGVTVTPPPTVAASYGANSLGAINVILSNTSPVTAVNLRITSVTNITAAAPYVVALLPNNVIPMSYGNVAGGQSAFRTFLFGSTPVGVEVPFSFTITYQADNMPQRTAVIDVPFPRSMSFAGSPLSIKAGASGNLTLNLLGTQAPAGGLTVNLSSSDPTRAGVPATVSFAAGATSVSVPVTGIAPGTAVITANATVVNFPATATATVNVTGAIGVPANTTVGLGQSALFPVTLAQPAPAGGVTVTLKSSDPSKVTITPASVVIPQGATTPTPQPQVTGTGIGSATITADATAYTAGNTSVTVTPPPTVTAAYAANFLQPINIVLSNTSAVTAINLRITSVTNITAAAPNVIALTSGNVLPEGFGNLLGGKAAVGGFIFEATAGSISVPFSFTITYQADNMLPRTAVIDVPFPRSMNFAASPLAIKTGASGNLTLNLLGNQAPAGGLTVTLSSSDPARATVPPTVSFAAGATSVSVPVTGIAPGTAVITANATVVNFPATATATVNVTGAIGVPANTTVGLGQSASFPVTLPTPAAAGGVNVKLKSSDPSRVTVTPASVVIPQGATTPATQPQVTGAAVGSATITADATGYTTGTTSVTVTPPPVVTASYGANFLQAINLVLSNSSAGTAVNLRITNVTNITAAAPNVIAQPSQVPFPWPLGDLPGGQTKAWTMQFVATAGSISVPFSFTITYQADNMPPRTAVINVPFPRAMSFSGSPLGISAGTSGKLTLNLTGNQAPAGGLTVALSSSNPSRATVPPTVSFAAGATSVNVPVAGITPGSAVITANATVVNSPATATATVNVGGIVNPPNTAAVGQGEA